MAASGRLFPIPLWYSCIDWGGCSRYTGSANAWFDCIHSVCFARRLVRPGPAAAPASAHVLTQRRGLLMAASMIMVLPVIILFFSAQRYFIQGITFTGMRN